VDLLDLPARSTLASVLPSQLALHCSSSSRYREVCIPSARSGSRRHDSGVVQGERSVLLTLHV
jgi:hypothetical protein